jgi:hypothetical protein
MGKESWVDNNHYRETSDDGKTSYLYESDGLSSHCVEVARHNDDGTTIATEADNSIVGQLFHGGMGAQK